MNCRRIKHAPEESFHDIVALIEFKRLGVLISNSAGDKVE